MSMLLDRRLVAVSAAVLVVCAGYAVSQSNQPENQQVATPPPPGGGPNAKGGDEETDGLKPWAEVSKGFEKVISTADGQSYYEVWTKKKDNSMLGELPSGFDRQRVMIAMTVASGEDYAGLQAGEVYAFWRRIGNRLALVEPAIDTRSTGDQESKSSVKRLFTDRVILDVPIACMGPNGRPVIDLKALLVGRARDFFGFAAGGNTALATIKSAKAFPENIEISFEWPTGGGRLQEFHYSISLIPDNNGYQPRAADERVGYFTTVHRDLGKFTDEEKWVRYINRWRLEKADPRLKTSPPKEPIVFYIEHTVPVRYRRWVREGLTDWNKAFEKVGIANAIEVYQQDETTGAHMEKDPEDRRYNFIRWLANDQGTAIGPSRVHPLTGQILDADIILTDGWIRHWWVNYSDILPEMALEGASPETLAWLHSRPQWDPRVRMAPPENRDAIVAQRMRQGVMKYGGHPLAAAAEPEATRLIGDNPYDGLVGRRSQVNGLCIAATGKAFDTLLMRMHLDILQLIEEERVADAAALVLADPIAGTWDASATIAAPEPQTVPFSLDLKHDAGNVSGTILSPLGNMPIARGTFDDKSGALTLTVDVPQEALKATLNGSVAADKITGTLEIGEVSGTWSATRTAGAAEPPTTLASNDVAQPERRAARQDQPDPKPEPKPEAPKDDKTKQEMLDGIPEWFIGPLLTDLTAHEVGHTLGLRHNFKASSLYTLAQINSNELKGKKPFTGSVMDYNPININMNDGPVQGDYAMVDIGPYDYWAIEYGYTTGDLKDVLKRVAEPELVYATDEDTSGPDPLARRYDFSKDPLDYAQSNMKLAQWHRDRIITRFVKDGQSWARATRGYNVTLGLQTRSLSMMANWIGGSFVHRDRKGDPNGRDPVTPVTAQQQRAALKWVIENSFRDEAFGLTPDLLAKMTVDKWLDWGGFSEAMQEPAWPVHDRIAGIQASVLTNLVNPTRLRRVYDNEFRTPASQDQITLPELFDALIGEIFSELSASPDRRYTARQPMVSSLRRNLQREFVDRMIDLTLPGGLSGESSKPISNLAVARLRQIKERIDAGLKNTTLDPYTSAHLSEASKRIEQALNAQFIYNQGSGTGGGFPFFMLGQPIDPNTPASGPGSELRR
ncbi:MAG: DUF5117 domain-containing protein [Phycisphaerae bacterium]|nr:DUF5117 domain-containing protein [Phycisphaerae bacterium]